MGGLSNKKLPLIKSMKAKQSKSFKQFMLGMQVINNIAKKFDYVVEFTPIKRGHYLEGLERGRGSVCQFILQKNNKRRLLSPCAKKYLLMDVYFIFCPETL